MTKSAGNNSIFETTASLACHPTKTWCETKKIAEFRRARTEQAPAPFASKVKQPAKCFLSRVSNRHILIY